jgi:outer membrane protein TolC
MKIKIIILSVATAISLQATTITELFEAINKQPSTKIDKLNSKMKQISQEKINAISYPTLNIFGNYTHYNSPTNLLPLDPLKTAQLTKNNKGLPFATTIEKVGVLFNMPLYIKELKSLSLKAKYLAKSAKLKKELNFFTKEASIVGANSNLQYLENLLKALNSTKRSVLNTKQEIEISVKSGRMAGIALDKINQKLNELDININNVKIQRLNLISTIRKLTNITLEQSVSMQLKNNIDYQTGDIFALKPLEENLKASTEDLKATKAKQNSFKVAFSAMWSRNYAQKDIRLHDDISEDYGYYQIGISYPLYNKSGNVDIQLKKIELLKNKMKLRQTEQELKSDIKNILAQLPLLEKSIILTKQNIDKQQNLLKFAKVSFKQGRMTQEDYLSYEDGVLNAKAKYYKAISSRWQSIAKLTVIYGIDLKGIIK